MKKITLIVMFLVANYSCAMDLAFARYPENNSSGAVVVGTCMVGIGVCKMVQSYYGAGHHAAVVDKTLKLVGMQKEFDRSVATVALGLSVLSWLICDSPTFCIHSIIR